MTDRPSLAQLRGRVFKHSGSGHPEIGNWLARRVGRPWAVYGTWAGGPAGLVGPRDHGRGAGLQPGGSGADRHRDAARVRGRGDPLLGSATGSTTSTARWPDGGDVASLGGVYFDYLLHHATALALGFALGFGLGCPRGVAALVGRGVRDRVGLDRAGIAQRLPLQGVLPEAQARRVVLSHRRRVGRSPFAPRRRGRGRGPGSRPGRWPRRASRTWSSSD